MKTQFENPEDLAELDRAHAVAAQMLKGQGFTRSLGMSLTKMDLDGVRKFKKEFPAYYRKHENMLEE